MIFSAMSFFLSVFIDAFCKKAVDFHDIRLCVVEHLESRVSRAVIIYGQP